MQKTLTPIVLARTPAFEKGFALGSSRQSPTWATLSIPIDEEDVYLILRNLTEIAQEGWLSDELLRKNAGLLVGWLVSSRQ